MATDITAARKISKRRQQRIRKRHCQEQDDYLWGQKRRVTPVLLPIQFGDGKQLVGLRPLSTRLHWYVIAIDSSIKDLDGDDFRDLVDQQLYVEIEEQFGRCHCESCFSEEDDHDGVLTEDDRDPFESWPAPCWQYGCHWWEIDDDPPAAAAR